MEPANAGELPDESKRNMVFHRFLCYFLLWLSVAGNLLSAAQCFSRPQEMANPAYETLTDDVLRLNDDLKENVAVPFFTCNTSRQLPRKGDSIAPEVNSVLGRIILLSAADGVVCTSLPAVLGMSVTGSFAADGILRIVLCLAEGAAALLLMRRKRLGALLVQLTYLVQTLLLIILMFTHFSFPYLVQLFADLLMAGFTTVYYVHRKNQMTSLGEKDE